MTDAHEDRAKAWDPEKYEGGHEYVYEYGRDVLDLLDPQPGERILDLGCGTGHLTSEIAGAVGEEGAIVGIDSSPAMVAEARAAYPDVDFVVADATEFDLADVTNVESVDGRDDRFDAVFSNAALHWITDQTAVTECVHDALVPGGRYVAEFGGRKNVEAIVGALLDAARARGGDPEMSWYFAAIGEHASLLEAHGFETRFMRLFDRPTALDGGAEGLADWIATFGDSLLVELDEGERDAVVADVEDQLRTDLYDAENETWVADYRRLRFVAVPE